MTRSLLVACDHHRLSRRPISDFHPPFAVDESQASVQQRTGHHYHCRDLYRTSCRTNPRRTNIVEAYHLTCCLTDR